ncbi:hypothetical protein DUNSADRAFT_3324 [Dunaliella salina]|uniref:Uncharacterized protein n=1 Tax=Dunaliella salina TaxID=3046 RepID=A0ABQ7FVV8_DUNSA|nr:hypothetical protein DUNSADRAFT_3324 [Dunaliella salina]|eukprot:KAF5826391.1 hypothetical protein DUNSADRAFT_3324 [Dunaliella salina]
MHNIFAHAALDSEDSEDSPSGDPVRRRKGTRQTGAAKVDLVAEQTPGAAGAVCAARIQHASSEPLDAEEQAAWVREQEARQAMQKQRLQQLQQQQQSKRRRLAKQQQLQQQQQQEEGGTGVSAAAMQEQRLQRQQQQQQQQQQEKEGTGVSAVLAQQAASACAIHNRPASLCAAPFPVPTTVLLPQTAEFTHPAHGGTTHALAEAWRRAQPQQHVDLYPPGALQPVQPSVPQPPRTSQRAQHDGAALHIRDAMQPAQPSAAHPPRSSQHALPGGKGLRNPQALHPAQPSVPHPPRNLQHAQPGGAPLRTPEAVQSAQPSVPHPPKASQYLQPGGAESHIPQAVHPVQPSVPHPPRSSQHAQPNGREHHLSKITPSQTVNLVHASAPHPQNASPQVPLAQTSALNPPKTKSLQPEQPAQPVMHQPPPNTLQRTQPMVLHPPPNPTSTAAQPALSFVDTLQGLQSFFLHVRNVRRFGFALNFCSGGSSGRNSGSGARAAHHPPEVAGVAVSVEDGCCYYLPVPRPSGSAANSGGGLSSHSNARTSGGSGHDIGRGGHDGGNGGDAAARLWALTQERRLADRPRDLRMQGLQVLLSAPKLTKERRLADRPRDLRMQGLQVLLSDPKLTKVSVQMKQQHQSLDGHPFLRIAGSCVDVRLALYLTEPTALSGTSCSSTQALEQHLIKRASRAAVSQALQGLPVAGGVAHSTIELSKGEQEALRAAALSRKLYDVLYPGEKWWGQIVASFTIELSKGGH